MRCSRFRFSAFLVLLALASFASLRADDGYRLWLRYDRIEDETQRAAYAAALPHIELRTPSGQESPTLAAARDELTAGLKGLLGLDPKVTLVMDRPNLGAEAYAVQRKGDRVTIAGGSDVAVLYGTFALLREVQLRLPLDRFDFASAPKISHRLLNHWDNLPGTIERGYAGRSLWEWNKLPNEISPRYRDYARACASIGINGSVITNVNANAQVLTPEYLAKVAALAGAFRPYGIKLYLTARFSAPVEIGGLKTADPLDADVIKWWRAKADEIYKLIPDFGGFLVKANSEGQPGPQTYQRSHADGANCLADAVAPHGGIVIWRAFVYDAAIPDDRHKQAYSEFVPLDGKFHDNVVVQVKNGAIDFMPREPFHPLFGAMPKTPLALEVEITQEYTGGSSELCFLAPMWREVLTADTFRPSPRSTVARVVDGSIDHHALTVIAGVANTGSDRNWCGNQLAPANWYAFGRLAWDHALTSEAIADEWTRLTFGPDPRVRETLVPILLASRETVVNYSMPLGLHHQMARGHHQGPGPWVTGGRADQTSVYYNRADEKGLGFDRTATGSNALGQYAPEAAKQWADPKTCPDIFLLWFHHLPWDFQMKSGRTLWDELCLHYQQGVNDVRLWEKSWAALANSNAVDAERFASVQRLFHGQEREARIWRDACTQYFATFSKRPLPAGVEPPSWPLAKLRVGTPFSVPDN